MTRGFLLGKFMPPHAGHQLLIETAHALVDQLTVLVCWLPDDPIAGEARLGWMREMFPGCRIVGCDAVVPQTPEEHPDFWPIWRGIVRAAHPEPIDLVFASESYGHRLAAEAGARYRPIDPLRDGAPVSATAVRADPWGCWERLPPPVRAHFAQTIGLHGPESVGKSTLAVALAEHFGTIHVPEYGRTWCAEFDGTPTIGDLCAIAQTQDAMAASLKRRCNRRLILDTDPLMTAIWADMLYGRRDPWFAGWSNHADLYLLLDTYLPWIDDGTRLFGGAAERTRFAALCQTELEQRRVRWAMVSGNGVARLHNAVAAIEAAGVCI